MKQTILIVAVIFALLTTNALAQIDVRLPIVRSPGDTPTAIETMPPMSAGTPDVLATLDALIITLTAQSFTPTPTATATETATPTETATATETATPNALATQLSDLQTAVATLSMGTAEPPNATIIALEQTVTALIPTPTGTPTPTETATSTPTLTETATPTSTPDFGATLDALIATLTAQSPTLTPTATEAGGTIPQP